MPEINDFTIADLFKQVIKLLVQGDFTIDDINADDVTEFLKLIAHTTESKGGFTGFMKSLLDVNADGKLDSDDVKALFKSVLDVNNDGKIDYKDALALVKEIVL